ncbi:hypothetical protein E2C01_010830 [Portunus trituberculatus]|uniref:Uncharacterized protein n=1 Tax=Portunus trituberculatus TaxID=210409 RepID=A0A5B7D9G6_PORTR|nr:hypothetical protein [Portunus trituberculatus]
MVGFKPTCGRLPDPTLTTLSTMPPHIVLSEGSDRRLGEEDGTPCITTITTMPTAMTLTTTTTTATTTDAFTGLSTTTASATDYPSCPLEYVLEIHAK